MERTKNNTVKDTEPKKIRWKKEGGGSFDFRDATGRITQKIKPGQIFLAFEHEIPQAFRDVVIALDTLPSAPPPPVMEGVEVIYKLKSRGKGEYDTVDVNGKAISGKDLAKYNVVDSNEKAINEKGLTKEVAEKLVQDLAR